EGVEVKRVNSATPNAQLTTNAQLPKLPTARRSVGFQVLGVLGVLGLRIWALIGSCVVGRWNLTIEENKNGGDVRPRFWRDAAVSASCRPFSFRPLLLSLPCVPPWNKAGSACYRRPGVTTGGLSGPPSYKM